MTKKKSVPHGSYGKRRMEENEYDRMLREADPNAKQEEKVDMIFDVDDTAPEEEAEEMSFIDTLFNVWDAYTD
jgi:hypothetical protein